MQPRELDMPIPAETETFAELMDRHGIVRKHIAADAGVTAEHISRCLGGQYPVPMAAWQALWRITRDPEIPAVIFGDDDYLVIELPTPPRSTDRAHGAFVKSALPIITQEWGSDRTPASVISRCIQAGLKLLRAHSADGELAAACHNGRAA